MGTEEEVRVEQNEEYQGFVPIIVFLPGKRIEGKAWKEGARRLLEHIETEKRQFLPIVQARVSDLTTPDQEPEQVPVIAVNRAAITAIIPGDVVTPPDERRSRRSGRFGV